jgi:predicted nuclease of predicted toxin-antitoxin system
MPAVLRFHLDESLTPDIAAGLRRRGRDCTTTQEAGLMGVSDTEQLAFATTEGRIVITADQDFLRIAAVDQNHAGIIFCTHSDRIGAIIKAIDALCFERPDDDFHGTVTYV